MIVLNANETKEAIALNRALTSLILGKNRRVVIATLLNRLIAEESTGVVTPEQIDATIAATRAAVPAAREAFRKQIAGN